MALKTRATVVAIVHDHVTVRIVIVVVVVQHPDTANARAKEIVSTEIESVVS